MLASNKICQNLWKIPSLWRFCQCQAKNWDSISSSIFFWKLAHWRKHHRSNQRIQFCQILDSQGCQICGFFPDKDSNRWHWLWNSCWSCVSPTRAMTWQQQQLEKYGHWTIFLNLIAILYYAFLMEPITTIIHICSLILSAGLFIRALTYHEWSILLSVSVATTSQEPSSF